MWSARASMRILSRLQHSMLTCAVFPYILSQHRFGRPRATIARTVHFNIQVGAQRCRSGESDCQCSFGYPCMYSDHSPSARKHISLLSHGRSCSSCTHGNKGVLPISQPNLFEFLVDTVAELCVKLQGLSKLLADHAAGCCREQKYDNYFGRKIAIDASMHIYQALVR